MPADPAARLVGMNASPEALVAARHSLGWTGRSPFNLPATLASSVNPAVARQSGKSWSSGAPIVTEIKQTLPITLELITLSFTGAFLVAFPIGTLCATRPGGWADKGTFVFSLFAGSQPEFWWGVLFIYIFFYLLNVAPPPLGRLDPLGSPPAVVTGFITIDLLLAWNFVALADGLHHLMLPVATKVFVLSGPMIKMIRQNMVRALGSDYIL